MSSETLNLIIGAALGGFIGFATSLYGYKYQRKTEAKDKTKYLKMSLRKAIAYGRLQVSNLETFIATFSPNDYYHDSEVKYVPNETLPLFAENIVKQDYYSSFLLTYKNTLNPFDKFLHVEMYVVGLNGILSTAKKNIEMLRKENIKIDSEYHDLYTLLENDFDNFIMQKRKAAISNSVVDGLSEKISSCRGNLKTQRLYPHGIKAVHEYIVNPLMIYKRDSIYNPDAIPSELLEKLNKLHHLYAVMASGNKELYARITAILPDARRYIVKLDELYRYFEDPQVKQFTNH